MLMTTIEKIAALCDALGIVGDIIICPTSSGTWQCKVGSALSTGWMSSAQGALDQMLADLTSRCTNRAVSQETAAKLIRDALKKTQ